jgi:hypothetical protein
MNSIFHNFSPTLSKPTSMETNSLPEKRPVFLTILCILSFVGLCAAIMKSLFMLAFSQLNTSISSLLQSYFDQALSDMKTSDPNAIPLVQKIFDSILSFLNVLPAFAALILILSIVALTGVILMWNLKKAGYFIYSGAKVIIIFVPVILTGPNLFSMIAGSSMFMTAAVFITLYGLNLKAMK